MGDTNNNAVIEQDVEWVGASYDPDVDESYFNLQTRFTPTFYRGCTYGNLSLKIGSYVLVKTNSAETYDVGCIQYLLKVGLANLAYVQWYSYVQHLPPKLQEDERYQFDPDRELVEDKRYDPRIDIETISGLCHVEIVKPSLTAAKVIPRIQSKLPVFVARYRFTEVYRSKTLEAIINDELSPSQKRKSTVGKASATKSAQRDPLRPRMTRSQSIQSDLDGQSSDGGNMDTVTKGMSVVEISDEENISPRKMSRIDSARRKSGNFRRNLDSVLRCESPMSDAEIMNYSIVKDEAKPDSQMKIKLRLSEIQKTTPRSTRKRTTNGDDTPSENQISPRKSRRSVVAEEEMPSTPTSRPRRKSILKTPGINGTENTGSAKRHIQLSNIAEELTEGRRSTKKLLASPARTVAEEPKTPRSRGRPPKDEYKSTPKSASKIKLIRSGAIKPDIHSRDAPVEISQDDQLAIVRERLHVSAVPQSLPCRVKEFTEIYDFLEEKIVQRCGGCMYVSGVPGTGKTATTTAVIRSLQEIAGKGSIPGFEFIEINGMRLTEPRQAYVQIYRQLTGKTLAWQQAYNLLNKRFTSNTARREITVLLVDELDILCNKRQDVVYNLLNWPNTAGSRLIVVTIANTMDLPERLLMAKAASRLGLTRLTFQPYNFRQLQEIVAARLAGTSAFDDEAVQMVARKVAAVSGDARRALDICRRATELAEDASRKTGTFARVSMGLVQQALGEMIASAKVQTIKCCSRLEQLFLQAVTAEVLRTGIEECNFLSVYSQFEALALFEGITVPNPSRVMTICGRLGASRLLICEDSRNDIYQKILLNVSSDDVHYALRTTETDCF